MTGLQNTKIGIIGLAEAGNLGDDLILLATLDAVYAVDPLADVRFLSHGQSMSWDSIRLKRGYPRVPDRTFERIEIPLVRQNRAIFDDRDVIIFGGGGLLQTSHAANRPYSWLSHLPHSGTGRPRVLATGLGLGPISSSWLRRLRELGTPFDSMWVRDNDSAKLAEEELLWPSTVCHDFIDQNFLSSFVGASGQASAIPADAAEEPSVVAANSPHRVLGVALREWPGFSIDTAVEHVKRVADSESCTAVHFFVLEANRGGGPDVVFSNSVAQKLVLPTKVSVYSADRLYDFIGEMHEVDVAISMKLHSSAIWQAANVAMYPIVYAPKVAAFFDRTYSGFEIVDEITSPAPFSAETPTANEVIQKELPLLASSSASTGSRFSRSASWKFQLSRIRDAINRRIDLAIHPLHLGSGQR